MGLFEEQPLLLIPWILAVVATYDVAKWVVRRALRARSETEQLPPTHG